MEYRVSDAIDVLLGKRITEVTVSSDKETIIFLTDDEEMYVFRTQADCCNEVWIESIEGTEYLIREKIIDIKEKDYAPLFSIEATKDDTWGEVKEVYNIDLITQKGTFTIDFRNTHNGYYGGQLSLDEWESTIKPPTGAND